MIFSDFYKDVYVLKHKYLRYNIESLQKEFIENVYQKYRPCWQDSYDIHKNKLEKCSIDQSKNYTFGGWSLLSNTGHLYDGWFPDGYLPSYNLDIEKDFEEHNIKTEICQGIFLNIIDELQLNKYNPSRARITISKKDCPLKWHSDSNDNKLITRIHIPIITNSSAIFMSKTKSWHMPADGSMYVLNTNHLHRNQNNGDLRFHIIIDVSLNEPLLDDFVEF